MIETSCGAILYYNAKEPQYLLLHYPAGHWGFAKGKVEKGESKEETVIREVQEETGIKIKTLDFLSRITYHYTLKGKPVFKQVFFFIARAPKKKVVLSHEHQDFVWLPYKEALSTLTFKNEKVLLSKAHRKLR